MMLCTTPRSSVTGDSEMRSRTVSLRPAGWISTSKVEATPSSCFACSARITSRFSAVKKRSQGRSAASRSTPNIRSSAGLANSTWPSRPCCQMPTASCVTSAW